MNRKGEWTCPPNPPQKSIPILNDLRKYTTDWRNDTLAHNIIIKLIQWMQTMIAVIIGVRFVYFSFVLIVHREFPACDLAFWTYCCRVQFFSSSLFNTHNLFFFLHIVDVRSTVRWYCFCRCGHPFNFIFPYLFWKQANPPTQRQFDRTSAKQNTC